MIDGIRFIVRAVDIDGLPSPHIEVWFEPSRHPWSARRMTLLFMAAMVQGMVPTTKQWGALAIPAGDADSSSRVLLTNVAPAELCAADRLLSRFAAAHLCRPLPPDPTLSELSAAQSRAHLVALVRAHVEAALSPAVERSAAARIPIEALQGAVDAAFALGLGHAVSGDALAQVAEADGRLTLSREAEEVFVELVLPTLVPYRYARALALALQSQIEASPPRRETWSTRLEEPKHIETRRWKIVLTGIVDDEARGRAYAHLAALLGAS